MKKNIHPEYHSIKVVMTDGTEFTTKSTYGKEGEVLELDVDGKKQKVIPRDVSYHVVSEEPIHIDFMRMLKKIKLILIISFFPIFSLDANLAASLEIPYSIS